MSLLAAHLNEASISLLSADRVYYREPGFALIEYGSIVTGEGARQQARLQPRSIQLDFWSRLNTESLTDARFTHLSAADLVSEQLEAMWQTASAGDELLVAVPASMSREQIALLLGIAEALEIPITGVCDAAVAATRREYQGAVPIHIDVGLHTAVLTRLSQTSGVQFERAETVTDAGVQSLGAAWIRKISDCFVRQSRFDPLHTAETEQLLFDSLPDWLLRATSTESVNMQIEYKGLEHSAEIESLDLIAAAGPVYQRVAAQLRALVRAGETPALQLSERAASLPGLADMLKARVGGDVFILEAGATARGLLARFERSDQSDGAIGLLQRLPWDQTAMTVSVASADAHTGSPTHVLFDSVAYPISSDAIVLGSQKTDGARWIDFERAMPGMSRQHCSIVLDNGQSLLTDQSRYGTFLNGHRIDGSAVLQCGDVVRLGTPGFELQLIRIEG